MLQVPGSVWIKQWVIFHRLQAELEEARRKVQEEMLEELELEKGMVGLDYTINLYPLIYQINYKIVTV